MKALCILLLTAVFATGAVAQPEGGEGLPWQEQRPLTWTDYRGRPAPGDPAAAVTATRLEVSFQYRNGVVDYSILSRFSPERSWVRHRDSRILAHEQGHFDIAEIFARRLHKALQEYPYRKKTVREDLNRIYERILKEKEETQEAYDRETDHSRNREQQEAWLKKIRDWLEETKPWQDYTSGRTGQE